LNYTEVGDEGVKALAALPVLSHLDLYGTDGVGDTGVRALVSFPALDVLILRQGTMSDESQALLRCCRISHVELIGN
jgi:GrpB-like predicted nucleotidyltransferase (UPF0157 family)